MTAEPLDTAPVVVVDLDGTLYAGDSFREFLLFLVRTTRPGPRRIVRLAQLVRRLRNGSIERVAFREEALSCLLQSSTPAELASTVDRFVDRTWQRSWCAKLLACVERRHAAGRVTLLATASPDLYVPRLVRHVPFQVVLCSRTTFDEGRVRFPQGLLLGSAKYSAVKRSLAQLGQPPHEAAAVSDHHFDLDLLEGVRWPFVLRPSWTLSRAAESRGWARLDWEHTSVAKAPESEPPRLVYIVTHPGTAKAFLRGQVQFMVDAGFEVTVIAAPGLELAEVARTGVTTIAIPLEREIRPGRDLLALIRLTRLLRRLRPAIVNASTPKAGLLGLVAAWLGRVPVRIYTLRGLRLETTTGLRRAVLSIGERISHACAQRVICVSSSLAHSYRKHLGFESDKLVVLGDGSSNGVDLTRFRFSPDDATRAAALRNSLDITSDHRVIGFVGRITRDKGIEDLYEAFRMLRLHHPEARLLILGNFESGDTVPAELRRRLRRDPNVFLPGFLEDALAGFQIMRVLALPSYREGFPNVVLEAAALSIPTVGYDVTGTCDAIEDGVTGTLVPRGDVRALSDALRRYLDQDATTQAHGHAARDRVEARFQSARVWGNLRDEYQRLLTPDNED